MRVWIGKYYSDIVHSAYLFDYVITLHKPHYNTKIKCFSFDNSRKFISITNEKFILFVYQTLKNIGWDKNTQLFFYTDEIAEKLISLDPALCKYALCCNIDQHAWLKSKAYQRLLLKDSVNLISYKFLPASECNFMRLRELFPMYEKFVVQENYSSGGHGTYFIDSKTLSNKISREKAYLVTPFIKGKSYNAHIIVTNDSCIIFPISEQKVNVEHNDASYNGAKFIPFSMQEKVLNMLLAIRNKLNLLGYRGVCGIDFLLTDSQIYFIELNCRFQGSSMSLDKYINKHYHYSLYDLHIKAFDDKFDVPKELINMLNIKEPFEYTIIKKSCPTILKPTEYYEESRCFRFIHENL